MLVSVDDFSDAALVILGHGSTKNARSGATVYQHAAELRGRRIFGEVREAFWKQAPPVKEVLAGLSRQRIFIVPLFISEGYFSENVIPRALGFNFPEGTDVNRKQRREGQELFYCRPVGTHPRMTAALLARAREVVQKFPFPQEPAVEQTTLFVAGHGTEQDENSRASIERQVELVKEQEIYADVHAVFLEEQPRIDACYQLAQTRNVVVVPFFVSEGMHVEEDIPVLLGEPERMVQKRLKVMQPTWRNPTEKQGKLVWYSSSVGGDRLVAEIILERVREAMG